MDINQALTWMQEYVEAEWTSISVAFTETDLIIQTKKWRPVRKFVAKGVSILDVLPSGTTKGDALSRYQKRKMYAVTKAQSKKFGEVFTFYVGTTHSSSDRPSSRIHSAEIEGEMKIIAWEHSCSTCRESGTYQGRPCEDCHGRGWTGYRGNMPLDKLIVVEKRVLER